jgi:hypothetical protein
MTCVLRITTLLVLAVCSAACSSAPSSFFQNFSLQKIVGNNKSQIHADCEPPNGGGGISGGGWSGFSSLGKRANYSFSKSTAFTCKLDPNGFDEAVAMPLLQRAIEQSISESGAKVTRHENPERASFTLTYTVNGAEGKLTVAGKEVFAQQYSFQVKLEESRKEHQ